MNIYVSSKAIRIWRGVLTVEGNVYGKRDSGPAKMTPSNSPHPPIRFGALIEWLSQVVAQIHKIALKIYFLLICIGASEGIIILLKLIPYHY